MQKEEAQSYQRSDLMGRKEINETERSVEAEVDKYLKKEQKESGLCCHRRAEVEHLLEENRLTELIHLTTG